MSFIFSKIGEHKKKFILKKIKYISTPQQFHHSNLISPRAPVTTFARHVSLTTGRRRLHKSFQKTQINKKQSEGSRTFSFPAHSLCINPVLHSFPPSSIETIQYEISRCGSHSQHIFIQTSQRASFIVFS